MPSISLIDICFNFTHKSFRKDESAILQRATENHVDTMIVTGSNLLESQEGIALAERYPQQLYATCGVHPHLAKEWDSNSAQQLADMLVHPKVCAVGEAGLDYNRDFSPRDQQKHAFQAQLELAVDTGLPTFLHERDAHEDFLALLARYQPKLKNSVVHCFTGTRDQMHAYLDLGCYIGITGWICDERRGHHLHEFVNEIPTDRLMIETDAPYLLPRSLSPQPGDRRNEPAFLPHILEQVATLRGVTSQELAVQTTTNATRFFQLNSEDIA